jgi:molybdate transport system substrate-binding protein
MMCGKKWWVRVCLLVLLCIVGQAAQATEAIAIAAAADLKFAMDEIITSFKQRQPDVRIEASYGSSGSFSTQIQQGAPYDLYFSADIHYPELLRQQGWAASAVRRYGVGRIVVWRASQQSQPVTLADLADPAIQKIALANPSHAPYGKRAEEALRAVGMWDKVEPKLVYGENVTQAAQFVQSGNAQIGIIALSLALSANLSKQGSYATIPDSLYQPLEQGFIITKRAAHNTLAQQFAHYMVSEEARKILSRYGFALP